MSVLRPASCVLRVLAIVAMLGGCYSASDQPLAAPDWDTVPAGVLNALCQRLKMDGTVGAGDVVVLNKTQPIASTHALAVLGSNEANKPTIERASQALQFGLKTLAVEVDPTCGWTAADAVDLRRHSDVVIVEISAPVANPYVPPQAGIFARVSVGGDNASWYWISLVPIGGGWAVGTVTTVGM
jgi:hypothetical protein